jgi:hypothetical protein
MSYDEMLIAALYAVACPTYFINNGERRNCAKVGDPGTYEPEGVFVALVGARFENADKMESTLMIVTPSCTESNGFGAKADFSKVIERWMGGRREEREKGREKGEGRREKGEQRRENREGRTEKGEQRREKREGRREKGEERREKGEGRRRREKGEGRNP